MERDHNAAMRELHGRCKNLTRELRNLPNEISECGQPFDMDSEKLDKIRFELLTAQHKVLVKSEPCRLALDNEFAESIGKTSWKKEIEDMKMVSEIQMKYIHNKEKDSDMNKDARKCFHEILDAIEDKGDVEVERSESKRKVLEAKFQTKYILEAFYPEHQSELMAILEKLEKCYSKENESKQWLDLSEHNITPVLILKQAMIIKQHKTVLTRFRFAPLI